MKKFRKKPVVIEAIQFDIKSNQPLFDFIRELKNEDHNKYLAYNNGGQLYVKTLEGDMLVSDKDWLIHGVNGEFYPCKPDIFQKTYDAVQE